MRTPRKAILRVDVGGESSSSKLTFKWRSSYALGCLLIVWLVVFIFWLVVPEGTSSLRSSVSFIGKSKRGRDTSSPLHHDKMQLQDDDKNGKHDFERIQRIVGEGGGNGGTTSGAYAGYDHAVIVVGHAVVKIDQIDGADKDANAWHLLPYQREQGFPGIISSHIERGAEIVKEDPTSLLLFSGGETRRDVGPMSEAASYYFVAKHNHWLPEGDTFDHPRTFLEEYARDSFENLLFSLCRFREITSRYPAKVTVVGFDFKAKRFADLHARALSIPYDKFRYEGLQPTSPNFDHVKAETGEKSVRDVFARDPYSCSSALESKRHLRNPFKRTVPYDTACPEIELLLHWCGPELYVDAGNTVPWGANEGH